MSKGQELRPLTRDAVKYMAVFAMLLNHIAVVFLEPGTWPFEILKAVGYFTAVTMIYFLIEGYQYTHAKKAYITRLFLFALLSEIPYCLAFTRHGVLEFCGLNMLFTLCLCFALVWIKENIREAEKRLFLNTGVVALSICCDWAVLAPLFTLFFLQEGSRGKGAKKAFAESAALFGFASFLEGMGKIPLAYNGLLTAMGMAAMGLSAVCILYFYNGKRAGRGRTFSQWFFYLFYPIHLLVLGLLRIWMQNGRG